MSMCCPQCQAITIRERFFFFFCQIVSVYMMVIFFKPIVCFVLYMNSHMENLCCCCCFLKTGHVIISDCVFIFLEKPYHSVYFKVF